MAAVQPPATYDEWRTWAAEYAISRWLDIPTIEPVPGFPIPGVGPVWAPVADDHPLKGTRFCWRCVAQAQGIATGEENVAHNWTDDVICFEAARDETPEHPEQDPEPAGPRAAVDLGFGPEFERPTDFTDTGTIFYEERR